MSAIGGLRQTVQSGICQSLPSRKRSAFRVRATQRDGDDSRAARNLAAPAGFAAVLRPQSAKAVDVDSVVDATVGAVKTTGEYVRKGVEITQSGVDVVKKGIDTASPAVKDIYETVAPAVSSGVKALSETASPAIKAAAPSVESGVEGAEKFLAGQGINLDVVKSSAGTAVDATKGAVTAATPAVDSLFKFVTTTDPVVLGGYAVGAAALYYLGPPLLGVFFASLKGYGGDISAPAALDTVVSSSNSFIVDVRLQNEKEASGIPDLPSSAGNKYIELEFAVTENRKIRNQLRNAQDIECQITAMQIAGLKRLSKGSTIYIMDKNGSTSRSVAKELNNKGFKNCYVISGGFGGWTQSKLQVKPSVSVFRAEVIAPSFFGTGSVRQAPAQGTTGGRRALPPGR